MFGNSWRHWLLRTLNAYRRGTGRKCKSRSRTFRPWVERLETRTAPATIDLTPIADNTLYQVSSEATAEQ